MAQPGDPRRVLILCTGNSCRSQMAEGFVNHRLAGRWEARSAGTRPAARVHPLAVRAMEEVGIDTGPLSDLILRSMLGAGGVMLLVALGATIVPVMRATGVDPLDVPGSATRSKAPGDSDGVQGAGDSSSRTCE